jgi:three-Cys-motif partner protein
LSYDAALYIGREQTLVKHYFLRQYLVTFAHKVASFCDTLTYVDCFSGPWNAVSEDLRDASFSIALEELRKTRETYASLNRTIRIRCFFIEKDRAAYAKLRAFAAAATDVEVKTVRAKFEEVVPEILEFVNDGGVRNFPFLFIDPTGWTGFAMKTIEPLLKLSPVEVLINFMTSHVRRFVESPLEQTHESFEEMFGSGDFQTKVQGLSYEDKEDALIGEYMRNLKTRGAFEHVAAAMILDPEISRTAFHLVYATRHRRGLEVFKTVEKRAMTVMVEAQQDAARRKRDDGQGELFGGIDIFNPRHYEMLRRRYLEKAKRLVWSVLVKKQVVSYDTAWRATVSFPLVWESDLKAWIAEWKKGDRIEIEGLVGRQRVPQLDKNHRLRVIDSAQTPRVPAAR